MTLPIDPLSQPDPYGLEPTKQPAEAGVTGQVTGDAQMATRSDLGCAQGGEPDDNKDWLRSLKPGPKSGYCVWCQKPTERLIAVEAQRIQGRHWGLVTRFDCGCHEQK